MISSIPSNLLIGGSEVSNKLPAGLSSVGRIVPGTPHAADVAYEDVIPDIYRETARSVFGFANSLWTRKEVLCPKG